MPHNRESENKKGDLVPRVAQPQPVDPPPPPNGRNPSEAQHVGGDGEEGQIKGLEDRIHRAELWMIGLTAAIALFALCSVVVAVLQWRAMNGQLGEMKSGSTDTHNLAIATGNQATWTQNLAANMQTQADRTKDLADQMKDQADYTKTIAEQAVTQAAAAQESASVADESLRISQRAYLISGFPTLNTSAGIATMPIINIGHIPSGKAVIVLHEATIKVSNPNASTPENAIPTEAHWKHSDFDAVPPTAGTITLSATVPLPALNADLMNKGFQEIFLVGTISYNDGFPEKSAEAWNFCEAAAFNTKTKQIEWHPCDWSLYMRQLLPFDHYPQNEYPQ